MFSLCAIWLVSHLGSSYEPSGCLSPMPRQTRTGNDYLRTTHFHVYRARVATTQSQDESSQCCFGWSSCCFLQFASVPCFSRNHEPSTALSVVYRPQFGDALAAEWLGLQGCYLCAVQVRMF